MSDYAQQLGNRVRSTREAAGLTREQLAQQVGVTEAMIGHIENGIRLPSLPVAIRLAEALNVTADDLLATPTA